MRSPSILTGKKNVASDALFGLFAVVLTAAVIAALYFGRDFLVPLAVAALLTFVLSPLVARIERKTGRVAAVSGVAILVFCAVGVIGWTITRQTLDLATQLPNYRSNIETKLHALELSKDGPLKRFSKMVVEMETEVPTLDSAPVATDRTDSTSGRTRGRVKEVRNAPEAAPPPASNPFNKLQLIIVPFFSVLATSGVVIVLVIFMLLKREDLRGRLIKIVGQGRISSTSRAMEDAAERVSRYLTTQLIVNVAYGVTVAASLYFIGIPNAFLWGALSAVLRFIPYVGAWLAAFCPVVLALAVSPGWDMVLLTLGLFLVLELFTANLIEPLLYPASTGVSSLALIVAAIFWTWLWGPVGLLLSTPLTVCLGVLGRHVPRLSFISVLLGSEEALTPAEECYHRLLVGGLNEASTVVDTYVNANSLTALYDNVIIPTVTLAEMDFQREELEETQRARVVQGVKDIINDLSTRPISSSKIEADVAVAAESKAPFPKSDCRVVCISTRGERDEVAGSMLVHLLREQGFEASAAAPGLSVGQLVSSIEEFKADALCISVIPPTTLIHARHVCSQLRAKYRELRIVVGIWGATENLENAIKGLRLCGADEVVVSMAEAVVQFVKLSSKLIEQNIPAQIPAGEEARIAALLGLKAYASHTNPLFDRMARTLTRTFGAPIALVTLIDRDHQLFKSQFGLPEELSKICDIPRSESVCTYVVAGNSAMVVEDLSKDRRFAKNALFKKYNLRFYAGVPIRAPNGQPVGALCILDTKPRKFSDADQRLLSILGDEISGSLALDENVAPVELVAQR